MTKLSDAQKEVIRKMREGYLVVEDFWGVVCGYWDSKRINKTIDCLEKIGVVYRKQHSNIYTLTTKGKSIEL